MNKNEMPLVSVIMPVFNGELFITSAIESVIRQTFQDWELIIIDDGSTDRTSHFLSSFSDPRIQIIYQENSGESAARNRGLGVANGVYIGFLDADDLYLPKALQEMVEYLDKHQDIDVVFCDGFFCDEDGKPLCRLSEVRGKPFVGNILEPLLLDPTVISGIICTLIRHSSINKSGVLFDPRLVIGPDWDFLIHIAYHVRFGYLDTTTCMYRIHQKNITCITDQEKRRQDLFYGRFKVMQADWFDELSIPTRQEFFYQLFVTLLSGKFMTQEEIVKSDQFLSLPKQVQGHLLRIIATDYLCEHDDWDLMQRFLKQSQAVFNHNYKTLFLSKSSCLGPRINRILLEGWRTIQRTTIFLRSDPRYKRLPVPQGLGPKYS